MDKADRDGALAAAFGFYAGGLEPITGRDPVPAFVNESDLAGTE